MQSLYLENHSPVLWHTGLCEEPVLPSASEQLLLGNILEELKASLQSCSWAFHKDSDSTWRIDGKAPKILGIILPLKQLRKTAIVCRIIFACLWCKMLHRGDDWAWKCHTGVGICIAAVIEVFWYQTLTLCMVTKCHGKREVELPAQVCTKAALTHLQDASGVQFCQVLMFSSESRVGEMQWRAAIPKGKVWGFSMVKFLASGGADHGHGITRGARSRVSALQCRVAGGAELYMLRNLLCCAKLWV